MQANRKSQHFLNQSKVNLQQSSLSSLRTFSHTSCHPHAFPSSLDGNSGLPCVLFNWPEYFFPLSLQHSIENCSRLNELKHLNFSRSNLEKKKPTPCMVYILPLRILCNLNYCGWSNGPRLLTTFFEFCILVTLLRIPCKCKPIIVSPFVKTRLRLVAHFHGPIIRKGPAHSLEMSSPLLRLVTKVSPTSSLNSRA